MPVRQTAVELISYSTAEVLGHKSGKELWPTGTLSQCVSEKKTATCGKTVNPPVSSSVSHRNMYSWVSQWTAKSLGQSENSCRHVLKTVTQPLKYQVSLRNSDIVIHSQGCLLKTVT